MLRFVTFLEVWKKIFTVGNKNFIVKEFVTNKYLYKIVATLETFAFFRDSNCESNIINNTYRWLIKV